MKNLFFFIVIIHLNLLKEFKMNDIYTLSMIISIATFILATHITPGPTNIVLLSSVMTYGYKKSFPYMLANIISYPIMMILVGFGTGVYLIKYPLIMDILKVTGVIYLIWMAYKIATNNSISKIDTIAKTKPFTFLQSLIQPWLNPKAWIIYTSAVSLFVTSKDESYLQISIIVLLIFISMLITVYTWSVGGVILKRFFKEEKMIIRVNRIMAILLLGSIAPIII